MTTRDDFDRQLAAWLVTSAPSSEPEPLLGQVLARTARTRRRPAWRIPERWIPMSAITTRSAAVSHVPWRTVGLIALLVLALVGGAILIAGARKPVLPPPFGAAANGQLAYSVNGDIVVVDDLSGTPRTIIGGPAADSGPLFAPDGTRFAFVRGQMDSAEAQLWIANADGTDTRVLAPSPRIGWAEWSPQSDALAVLEDGDPSIVRLIDVETSAITEIDTGLDYVQSVLWRPTDGRQLMFRAKDASGSWGLYLMSRDGAKPRRLDLDPGYATDAYYAANIDEYFLGPTWTPDGTRLIYYGLEPDPGSPAGPGDRIHVANIDADGSVTSDQVHEFVASNDDEFSPLVLPDGDTVVFQSKEGRLQQMNVGSLSGRMSPRPLDLSADDYWISSFLSPDGREILSRLPAAGTSDIQTWATDLTTFTSRPVNVGGDDLTWQRRAP